MNTLGLGRGALDTSAGDAWSSSTWRQVADRGKGFHGCRRGRGWRPAVAEVRRPGSSVTHLLTAKDQCPPKSSPHLLALPPCNLPLECSPPRDMSFKAFSFHPISCCLLSGPQIPRPSALLLVSGPPPPSLPLSPHLLGAVSVPVSGPSEFANHLPSLIAQKYQCSQGTAQPKTFPRGTSDRPPWLWHPQLTS